jgi:hypothetical protein
VRHIILILTAILLTTSPVAEAAKRGAGWEQVMTQEGVAVERKTVPGSPLFAFRGEGVFDLPIGKLVTVLKTAEIAAEWVDLMLEHRVVRAVEPDKNLIYESYGLPWPIDDRDYVMYETMGYDAAQKVFTIDYKSVEDAALPPKKGFVRAVAFQTYWRLEKISDTQTKIEVEVHTDPKGALPAWLINLIQKDWPWKTISGLVKRAAKPDIQADPRVADW